MDELELAYLAGWFDGEGSVTIRKSPPKPDAKSPVHALQVGLTQVDRSILEWIQSEFAPHNTITQARRSDRWMPVNQFQIHSGKAANFLRAIFPYLRQKKAEVEIALEFFDNKMPNPSPKRLPPEEIEFRDSCRRRLLEVKSHKSIRGRNNFNRAKYLE